MPVKTVVGRRPVVHFLLLVAALAGLLLLAGVFDAAFAQDACPASKLRHTCSDHCCRMGADCRELDGPLRPTARLSAIGTFARSTRARQANRFAERPEFLRPVRARQGLG
jgi:hypothetical protein